jgi:hypothetical protein
MQGTHIRRNEKKSYLFPQSGQCLYFFPTIDCKQGRIFVLPVLGAGKTFFLTSSLLWELKKRNIPNLGKLVEAWIFVFLGRPLLRLGLRPRRQTHPLPTKTIPKPTISLTRNYFFILFFCVSSNMCAIHCTLLRTATINDTLTT